MSDHVIPFDHLPPGFGDDIETPPAEPAAPRPAATVLLMRDGNAGLEVLLLRRNRESGFVPGAYVFPGGRVDRADADARLIPLTDGLTPDGAASRLSLEGDGAAGIAFYMAAIREAFEETGLLLARDAASTPPEGEAARWTRGGTGDIRALQARDDLLGGRAAFPEIIDRLGCRLAGDALEYIAHWITPEAEPRRYDTRFFAAMVAGDREVSLDAREMVDARWLPPKQALDLNRGGRLPMVFPTLRTLEAFSGFTSAEEALESFRGRPVPPILPRLVRTSTGIGIEIPE